MENLTRFDTREDKRQAKTPSRSNGEMPALFLPSLQSAAETLAAVPEFMAVEEVFVKELAELLNASGCAVYRWNRFNHTLMLTASHRRESGYVFEETIDHPGLQPKLEHALQQRQALQLTLYEAGEVLPEHDYLVTRGIQAMLLLPMVAHDRTYGLVQLTVSQHQRVFTEQEITSARLLTAQAAAAVANAVILAESEKRLNEQTALRRASAVISSSLDLDSVLNSIAEQMCKAVNGTSAYICRYDHRTNTVTVIAEYIGPDANAKESVSDLGAHYHLRSAQQFIRNFLTEGQPAVWYADDGNLIEQERRHYKQYGGRSVLAVPMRYASKVVAYAEIWDSRSRRKFGSDEIALAQALGQQAAIAYDHARLHSELEQQAAELATLNRISQTITSTLELQQTLDIVAVNTLDLLGAEAVVIALLDKSEQHLRYATVAGNISQQILGKQSALNKSVWGWSMTQAKPVVVPEAKLNSFHDPDFDELSGLRTRLVVCAPLRAKGQPRGAIAVINKLKGEIDHNDLRLLTNIASAAATALENAILYERARREIVERGKTEAILEAERKSLADRVSAQTAELRKTNAELAHAMRLKDEFLASMSHELRTPLNAILGIAEGLQEQFYGPLNDRQVRSVQLVEHSGRHLLALINDILDVAKIESGELMLEMETISVPAICAGSLQFIKLAAAKKQISVQSEVDEQVSHLQADSRRLKQILINLLSNAVKFTPENGAIGLKVTGDPANQAVRFTVWDTGIGIAKEDFPRLFKPFVQLDSSLSRQFPGTGLGLSLVKRMTEMHSGSVSVESEVGQGSRFTVTLPWQAPDPLEVERALRERAALSQTGGLHTSQLTHQPSRTRILLAEDDRINAEIFIQFIESLGYQVTLVKNGFDAVRVCREEQPALILMDIQMPGMNGLEAIEQIRSRSDAKTIPIIALTALAMEGDQERCLAAGANEYLTKPVPLRQLKKIIRSYLR